jgi:hypothetical protein
MVVEYCIAKDLEGNSYILIEVLSCHLAGETEKIS